MPEVIDRQTIKALGIETRQDIMKMLANRPYTASEIAKIRKKHVTTIAEHLTVLEKSGLVRKKDSTNKWVYYELTERGEHLFKPQFYSWVVVLSLSIVFMFVGLLRLAGLNGTQEASQAVPGASRPNGVATASTASAIQNTRMRRRPHCAST